MKKRIFIAIDLADEARRKVSDYIGTLRGQFSNIRVGWDKPEKLHLTLKFLGDINEFQLAKVREAVEKTAKEFSSFSLQIAETGVFPSPRNARILWLGVEDEQGSLAEINKLIETECEKIGFAKEKRNFKAHLTIGRIREPHKAQELANTHLENEFEPVGFEVAEIVIYESKLQPTGSVYSVVSKSALKK